MTSGPSDPELVGRARRGELDAYEELVRRYQGLATRVAFVITGDLGDAEDVAQEAFLKAYSSLARVQPQAFRPWLLRIVANEARNLRKAARRRAHALARASGDLAATGPAPSPEMAVLADEQRTVLLRALEALREEDRLAISYRYLFELSENEMMEALGWPRGTVKSRLARALGRYRQQLGQLALLPPAAFALPHVARQLASWNEAELQQGLASLGAHLSALPVHDLSAALVPRLQAAGSGHTGPAWWPHSPLQTLAVTSAAITAVVVAAVIGVRLFSSRAEPLPPAVPVAVAAPSVLPAPTRTTIVVYGGDLSSPDRAEISRLLDVGPDAASETIGRDEVLSTLAAAGLPAGPDAETLSSVRLDCPSADGSLSARTEHVSSLSPLTYVTALLAAGSTDASAVVAAPAAKPVTGETAMVGMLRAAGRCTGHEPQSATRVSLGYLILGLTSQIGEASGDWPAAASVIAHAVQAVVSGQAHDQAGIASAIDVAAHQAGVSLDPSLRAQLGAKLEPLVGQDYGRFGQGYHIDQPAPNQARLVP